MTTENFRIILCSRARIWKKKWRRKMEEKRIKKNNIRRKEKRKEKMIKVCWIIIFRDASIFSNLSYLVRIKRVLYANTVCNLDCSFFKFPEPREEEEEQEEMFSKIKKRMRRLLQMKWRVLNRRGFLRGNATDTLHISTVSLYLSLFLFLIPFFLAVNARH